MRTITLVLGVIAFLFNGLPARADGDRLCPSMREALIGKVVAWVKGKRHCNANCTGCGCKGGPGFRSGRDCVGWEKVLTKCGKAPHLGCRRECFPVIAACADHANGGAWLKAFAASVGMSVDFVPADKLEEREAAKR
jgi:hypothetical protein